MKCWVLFLTAMLWMTPLRGLALDDHPSAADSARQVKHAEDLFEQGHTAEAKTLCESLLRTLPDRAFSERGSTLNVMSKIHAAQGDYDHAITSAQQSAAFFQQIGDFDGEAHALNNKGIAELQTGTYVAAEQDLQQALALSRKANNLGNQVQVLNNLGSAYFFRGSYAESAAAYDTALSLVNGNASAAWSDYWLQITKFNQATLLQRLGRYESALHAYREVEASSKALSGGDRAHLYANLGTLYRRLGDAYKALDAYRIAQQLYSKQHDADGEIAVLKNIGIAYALDLNDFSHAATIFEAALALARKTQNRREQMQAHLYLGETRLRSHDLALARGEFEQAKDMAEELATVEDQWKSLYGLGKVETLSGNRAEAEDRYRQAISLIERTRSQLPISALRNDFFADKRDAYDALITILFQKNDAREAVLFMERSRARNFQDKMQTNQGANTSPLTLDQIRAVLPPATALVEFWTAGDRIGLVWCTHQTAGLNFRQLRTDQQTTIQDALKGLPANVQSGAASSLSAVFPVDWSVPADVKHLLIIPDGWISYVPFDLLHAGTDSQMLLERYDISYLPSAALLSRKRSNRALYGPWTHELVAFGDPLVAELAGNPGNRNLEQSTAPRLPFSGQEIQNISHLARGTTQSFLQQTDIKQTFRNGTANAAFLLHVSTHAFADGENPENSRLLFSPENRDFTPSYVFLREIYDLDLSHVRLATISACDTEHGKIIRGEGVRAFSRALLSAGADSSVTALWRVDDQSTAEFMQQFYFFLMKENQPKAEALRLAKLKFLHSNSKLADPSVWAAFVLNGDGLSPIPRVVSWAELLLCVVALLALITLAPAAYFMKRRSLRML